MWNLFWKKTFSCSSRCWLTLLRHTPMWQKHLLMLPLLSSCWLSCPLSTAQSRRGPTPIRSFPLFGITPHSLSDSLLSLLLREWYGSKSCDHKSFYFNVSLCHCIVPFGGQMRHLQTVSQTSDVSPISDHTMYELYHRLIINYPCQILILKIRILITFLSNSTSHMLKKVL